MTSFRGLSRLFSVMAAWILAFARREPASHHKARAAPSSDGEDLALIAISGPHA